MSDAESTSPDVEQTPEQRPVVGAGRVWLCAQRSPLAQRRERLTGESLAHPARMLPDLAAQAVATYSRPGELVLDPMCGIGTTLVEALRTGRRAIGVELEPRWARVSADNLAHTRTDLAHRPAEIGNGAARVVCGDARDLDRLLSAEAPDAVGDVALVLTSPPYGSGVHGQVRTGPSITKHHHRYGASRREANLAHTPGRLAENMTRILRGCARVLRPDGRIVVVARPWRRHGELVDLPGQMTACAAAAGLIVTDRAVALLARIDDPTDDTADDTPGAPATGHGPESTDTGPVDRARLVVRSSFFARHNLLRARAARDPVHLITHEDVYVFGLPAGRGRR